MAIAPGAAGNTDPAGAKARPAMRPGLPLATGAIADVSGSLAVALTLPALCYAVIAGFGVFARKPA